MGYRKLQRTQRQGFCSNDDLNDVVLHLVSSNDDVFWQLAYPSDKVKSLKGPPITDRMYVIYYKKIREIIDHNLHFIATICLSYRVGFLTVPPLFQYLIKKKPAQPRRVFFNSENNSATIYSFRYLKFGGTVK